MKKTPGIWFILFALVLSSCQLPGFGSKEKGCGPSTLKIGEHSYQIKTIKTKKDGSLNIPANKPDAAFWVEGTDTNQVFALSPTVDNLALKSSLKSGDTATVTWENCNSTTYTLSDVETDMPANAALLDQSASQITIFVRGDSAAAGFVVKGDLVGETINQFNTPDAAELQAEVSLLETTTSADGKTIRVSISILNSGGSPITLSTSDVSLTSENAPTVAVETSEPALPKEIKAGATETFYFTFAHPNTQTATIKVLSAEYELEGY